MALRRYLLEHALERVLQATNLRRPQREALEAFHELITRLDRDFADLSREELAAKVHDLFPAWQSGGDFPQLTFALATGVGKTRLMGAIAAYLLIGGQSRNFLLLAPRAAILRKLVSEASPNSSKYLFVDPALVPEPKLWYPGNLDSFDAGRAEERPDVANLFVFSPQGLTGDDKRVARAGEFSDLSLLEYLSTLEDLVVIVDEAHHLGRTASSETKTWTESVRQLNPRIQIGMTATPRDEPGVNILYSYDLATCLREKLYTKDVRLVVEQRKDAGLNDEDWDRYTLDFGLRRLEAKALATQEVDPASPLRKAHPVMLVCAENTNHANAIERWLIGQRGFDPKEVLVTHSAKAKTEDDLARLVGIEAANSRVRVVVNVFELTEGWDVTNVYVIVPLRKMGTFQGAIQTMGRGLRLPAGRRVDHPELDVLDVLCFGRQSFEEILGQALKEYGEVEDEESYVDIRTSDDNELTRPLPQFELILEAKVPIVFDFPNVRRQPVEPDLDFDVAARKGTERRAVALTLAKPGWGATDEALRLDQEAFVRLVAARVIRDLRYLSTPLHLTKVAALVRGYLRSLGLADEGQIDLNWMAVAELIKDEIDSGYRGKEIEYDVTPGSRVVTLGSVVVHASKPVLTDVLEPSSWNDGYVRAPIGPWSRSVTTGAILDGAGEYRTAWILDHSGAVTWWLRNDPAQLRVPTPIGNHEPDFVFSRTLDGREELWMLEIKGEYLWDPPTSDARVKAKAARTWASALNVAAGRETWHYGLVLADDVTDCNTLEDLLSVAVLAAPK